MAKRTIPTVPATERAAKRTRLIIERLLREMQLALHTPERCLNKDWERLFGARQSMVANLQKLVAALAALPVPAPPATVQANASDITPEEMKLLKAWLKELPEGQETVD